MATSKGVIIGVVLAVGFVMLLGAGVVGYVGWRYYSAYTAAKMAQTAPLASDTPSAPTPEAAAPADATPAATPDATVEPTAEPATEPATEPSAEPAAPVRTKATRKPTRAPKTEAPATPEPEETREPERRPAAPKVQALEVSHVHGGLSKKTCTGTIQLLDTGFKYDAQTSEDDRQDHVEVRFEQVKKVEMKDPKTVEVSTTDKKWTFRGDGLVVAKIATHLNTHSKQFAGK